MYKATGIMTFSDGTDIKDKLLATDGAAAGSRGS